MKKLLVCMLTCFMAVSLLAGCGKKEEAKTVELDKDNPTVICLALLQRRTAGSI